jgi:hypothetical protein
VVLLESSSHPLVEHRQLLDRIFQTLHPFLRFVQFFLFLSQPPRLFLIALSQSHGPEPHLPPFFASFLDLLQKIVVFEGYDLLLNAQSLVGLGFQFHIGIVKIFVLAIFANALPFSLFLPTLTRVVHACRHRAKLTKFIKKYHFLRLAGSN